MALGEVAVADTDTMVEAVDVTIETVEEDAVAGIDINPTIIVLVVLGEVEGIDSEANRPIKILKR